MSEYPLKQTGETADYAGSEYGFYSTNGLLMQAPTLVQLERIARLPNVTYVSTPLPSDILTSREIDDMQLAVLWKLTMQRSGASDPARYLFRKVAMPALAQQVTEDAQRYGWGRIGIRGTATSIDGTRTCEIPQAGAAALKLEVKDVEELVADGIDHPSSSLSPRGLVAEIDQTRVTKVAHFHPEAPEISPHCEFGMLRTTADLREKLGDVDAIVPALVVYDLAEAPSVRPRTEREGILARETDDVYVPTPEQREQSGLRAPILQVYILDYPVTDF